jgi:hypothetical protein
MAKENKIAKCYCKKWKKHYERLNGLVQLQSIRQGLDPHVLGKDWEGFSYCPWCGIKMV